MSCKLSPKNTISVKCQILFSWKKRRVSSVCRLLNLPIAVLVLGNHVGNNYLEVTTLYNSQDTINIFLGLWKSV